MTEYDSNFPECPICQYIMINPRMYTECGHSACEHCMAGYENSLPLPPSHTAPIYKCPVCRTESLVSWQFRPRNHALQAICERYEAYAIRRADVPTVETCIVVKENVFVSVIPLK